jgi:predicted nucleic acid-binding protein
MRLYLDANPIIYAVKGVPNLRDAVLHWIEQAERARGGVMLTSCLSWMECRVRPLRDGNHTLLSRFDGFFSRDNLLLVDVSVEVIERATELRARHRFRPPDAIHLATAQLMAADAFLSGDDDLRRCPDLNVVSVRP